MFTVSFQKYIHIGNRLELQIKLYLIEQIEGNYEMHLDLSKIPTKVIYVSVWPPLPIYSRV